MFVLLGYKWKINGEPVTPTTEDIEQTLDRAKEMLYAEKQPSQIEVGRLLVRYDGKDHTEVYLLFGDYNV